jgi:cytochrome P450
VGDEAVHETIRSEPYDLASRLVVSTPPTDPWAIYRRLHQISPVTEVDGLFVATGYSAVSTVLKSAQFGHGPAESNRMRHDPRYPTSRFLQAAASAAVNVDPPAHTRLRRVLNQIFTARALAEVEPYVESLVHHLLTAVEGNDTVDLKGDFAALLPMNVIGQLVGFPEDDRQRMFGWGRVIEHASTPFVTDEQLRAADQATSELVEYAAAMFADRRAHPRDDMLTALVEATAHDDMTIEEFTAQLLALIIAGTQTTVHMITSGMVALFEHRDELERFRADRRFDHTIVDEILRFYPPLHTAFPRLAMQDVELDSVIIPAGCRVFPFVAAANRDGSVFPEPDRLLIDRDTTRPPQLSFGHGIHLCVGRALARIEGRVALRAVVDRFPDLEVDLAGTTTWATAMARGHARVPARLHG